MHVAAVAASDPNCVKTIYYAVPNSQSNVPNVHLKRQLHLSSVHRDMLGSFGDHMKTSSTSLTARAFTRSV